MKAYEARLVRYVIGDVDQELIIRHKNFVEHWLVLLTQDEMTAQANDIMPKTWVFEDQHRLRKKGVGHGLHKSDILCSTVGWLHKHSSMEKIMKDTGPESCSSNR